jgi:Pyruvate/2-oxoacid:ferredoxin oxidoreductase delta subunit
MAYLVSSSSAAGTLPGVQVIVNEARCRSCGICHELCPTKALGAESPLYKAEVVDIDRCTGCRICELLCTDFAINVVIPRRDGFP